MMHPNDREAPYHESAPDMEAVNRRWYGISIEVSECRQGKHGNCFLHISRNEIVNRNLHDRYTYR